MSMSSRAMLWIGALLFFGLFSTAGSPHTASGSINNLQTFLRHYLGEKYDVGPSGRVTTRFSYAFVSLHKGGQEVVVYINGNYWCGTGGCSGMILERFGSRFRIIQELALVRLPILVLPSESHGWHDLAMPVEGGGIINMYMAWLRFNGRAYPSNPTMAPRLPSDMANLGKALPLTTQGSLLY